MSFSPIAFFAYNRPEHTRLALESLGKNIGAESSDLYIFCDGAKSATDLVAVKKVREVVRSQQWCGTVHIIERDKNMGLANSIIAGVGHLCDFFGRAIVLEDDLILAPYFLDYMNKALKKYENDHRIMQVSGYMFPVKPVCSDDVFLLPFTTSWGWATWSRAWQLFDAEVKQFTDLASDARRVYEFNLNDSYPYFSMLKEQVDGKIDSWAIRWYFSVFMLNAFVLYPKHTLVQNTGFDGSGTHCQVSDVAEDKLGMKHDIVTIHSNVSVCNKSFQSIREYLSTETCPGRQSMPGSILSAIKMGIHRIFKAN